MSGAGRSDDDMLYGKSPRIADVFNNQDLVRVRDGRNTLQWTVVGHDNGWLWLARGKHRITLPASLFTLSPMEPLSP